MKTLKHYIMESVHTYKYRLRVAGDIDDNKLELLKYNLQKFSPIKIGDPKTTPIQKELAGFSGINNERVTSIDMDCRYPVIEPFVRQLAQLLGMDENRVRLFTLDYDNSIKDEVDAYANMMKNEPLLMHSELEEQPGAKEANKEYAQSYLNRIKKEKSGIEIPYQKKTPKSFDPFNPWGDDPKGQKSPMTTIKMPPKPKTGAMKG